VNAAQAPAVTYKRGGSFTSASSPSCYTSEPHIGAQTHGAHMNLHVRTR
jgi:hypothetical protein